MSSQVGGGDVVRVIGPLGVSSLAMLGGAGVAKILKTAGAMPATASRDSHTAEVLATDIAANFLGPHSRTHGDLCPQVMSLCSESQESVRLIVSGCLGGLLGSEPMG